MENKSLIVSEKLDVKVLFTKDGMQGILQEIEDKAMSHVPDIETKQGREDIASLAYKVARSKTLIDTAGKDLTSEWRKKVENINDFRKHSKKFLDDLKNKVRKPLDDWEAEEKRMADKKRKEEEDKTNSRMAQLAEYRCILQYQTVAAMTDEEFDEILGKEKADFERQQADEAAAEEEARAKEAAREAEKEQLEKQRKEQEDREAEIEAKEKALKEKEDKLAAEETARKEAKEKEEREIKEAAEKKERDKEKAAREEELKPDKEKAIQWVQSFEFPDATDIKDSGMIEIVRITVEYIELCLRNAIKEIEAL